MGLLKWLLLNEKTLQKTLKINNWLKNSRNFKYTYELYIVIGGFHFQYIILHSKYALSAG